MRFWTLLFASLATISLAVPVETNKRDVVTTYDVELSNGNTGSWDVISHSGSGQDYSKKDLFHLAASLGKKEGKSSRSGRFKIKGDYKRLHAKFVLDYHGAWQVFSGPDWISLFQSVVKIAINEHHPVDLKLKLKNRGEPVGVLEFTFKKK